MDNKPHYYMTVVKTVSEKKMSLICWFSALDSWLLELELDNFQNSYYHETPETIWHVHSNEELRVGDLDLVTDYGDDAYAKADKLNASRVVVNRNKRKGL